MGSMTSRLPSVLSKNDLPSAELQCAALDGEVYPLDSCYCPIDEFDTIHLRARALGTALDSRIIAERMTAAWVWNAALNPPRRHELCVATGARTRPASDLNAVLREVVIDESEIDLIAGVQVTSRLRTVIDILRFSESFDEREQKAVTTLLVDGVISLDDCVAAVTGRRNLPQKRRALERLARFGAQAA